MGLLSVQPDPMVVVIATRLKGNEVRRSWIGLRTSFNRGLVDYHRQPTMAAC